MSGTLAVKLTRALCGSARRMAPPKHTATAKQAFKVKKNHTPKEKKKLGTHYKFADETRLSGYEKTGVSVAHLPEFSAEPSESLMRYSPETETRLAGLGAFRRHQHHELFSNPVTLATANTRRLGGFVAGLGAEFKNNRLCLVGERGVGKSTLMTQAQALAGADTVLLHFGKPEQIANGLSDYVYNRKAQKYQQPMFTKRWIMQTRAANAAVFQKMPLTQDVSFVAKKKLHALKAGEHTLWDYVSLTQDFGTALLAFAFFVSELAHHSAQFPVLATIEDANSVGLGGKTKYRASDYSPIHLSQFEMGAFVLLLISGDAPFVKGGVLLAESSGYGHLKTLSVGLGLEEHDPYLKSSECDVRVAEAFLANGGVQPFCVANFSKEEARAFLRFCVDSRAVRLSEYPQKEKHKDSAMLARGEPSTADPAQQFEQLVQSAYVVSLGNPGYIFQATSIHY